MSAWLRITLLAACLSASAANAHHAPALYDVTATVTITGTVKAFDWVQPHTRLTIAVPNEAGDETVWMLEGMHPGFLGRRGWSRYTLGPGDTVEASFMPRKDGSLSGMLLDVILPDGTRKVMAIRPGDPSSDSPTAASE